jgi:hypothetical protein
MNTRMSLLRASQAVVLFATLALGVTPAVALQSDGVFQIDGDAHTGTCGTAFGGGVGCTGDDGDSLYSCPSDGGLGARVVTSFRKLHSARLSGTLGALSPSDSGLHRPTLSRVRNERMRVDRTHSSRQ